ncbi:hypothetical protein [Halodesulfovibrio spirochaetisodalis]|uniref:hypothetical protein n=1 Tax=Halodesulfovibrio spirochaetisodalis TaxID=1560234 RepID=UPI000AE00B75|nr:hypothetical protein [Halodesulfovibrio spirochaetisodalis]
MKTIFILLVIYIVIATFLLQRALGLSQFSDAIFHGIAAGILLNVIHQAVKRILKER